MPSRRCSGEFDQKQPAQRPERLPAEILLAFLIEQQHRLARVGGLGGGHQTGQTRAHDDHIGCW